MAAMNQRQPRTRALAAGVSLSLIDLVIFVTPRMKIRNDNPYVKSAASMVHRLPIGSRSVISAALNRPADQRAAVAVPVLVASLMEKHQHFQRSNEHLAERPPFPGGFVLRL
jgi:hypothetical protein